VKTKQGHVTMIMPFGVDCYALADTCLTQSVCTAFEVSLLNLFTRFKYKKGKATDGVTQWNFSKTFGVKNRVLRLPCSQRWFCDDRCSRLKAKFNYAILVADRSEAGRRPASELEFGPSRPI